MSIVSWFPRTTSSSNSWFAVGTVSQDFSARYDISISGGWATLEINGRIDLVAEANFLAFYTILSPAYRDFGLSYVVDGAAATTVSRDFISVYAITDELASFDVYRDLSALWQMDGAWRDFAVSYEVINDTSFPGWNKQDTVTNAWAASAAASGTWTPATQPTTTWN